MSSKCGTHQYDAINRVKIDQILKALEENGATITGDNPWEVDVHTGGVKLRGTWDERASTLSVIVTAKNVFAPCSKIWSTIDPLINHISDLPEKESVS
ncbi:MAG: hypothetical protein AAF551_12735 [Bacteroidota bacterium]